MAKTFLRLTCWLSSCLVSALAVEPLRIVTLHTVLTEIVREVGGKEVALTPLLSPGIDPHAFEPAPADIRRLKQADLVFAAGLGLETYLPKLVKDAKPGQIIEVGGLLPNLLKTCLEGHDHGHDHSHDHGETDPHWWHSLDQVMAAVDVVARVCGERQPGAAAAFTRNATAFKARLAALQTWARAEIAQIPLNRRLLVTSHDAFGYFARDFGFKVHPLLGASTAGEANARRVAATIDLIRREKIKAVFAEVSANPRLIQTIVRETGARLGQPLWGDGLGTEPGNATIEAMFRHNLSAIVDALR